MADITVRYEPRGAAAELFRSRGSEVCMVGAAGTGKSLACLYRLHLTALRNPAFKGLISRKTARSLTSTTLETFRKKVAREAIGGRLMRWYGGSMQEPAGYYYTNGAKILVGGMDNPDKIMSAEYDMIFFDEATELVVEDWEYAKTRLRNGAISRQQIIAACNPAYPTHWLKQRADAGLMQMLTSLHSDNPAYVNRDGSLTEAGVAYMAILDSLTGVRLDRLRHGRWAAAEGIIYDAWSERHHLVDRFTPPADWWRFWSIDWGFSNPAVVQWWAVDPDGRAYLYREIYHTGKTVPELAAMVLKEVTRDGTKDGEWMEPKPRAVVADHDAGDRVLFTRHTGLKTRKADKRVKLGLDQSKERLKIQRDGRPRLFIMRDARCHRPDPALSALKKPTCTAEEYPSYVWDEKHGEQQEQPKKEHDHGMDGKRYAVMYLDPPRAGRTKIHIPTGPLR